MLLYDSELFYAASDNKEAFAFFATLTLPYSSLRSKNIDVFLPTTPTVITNDGFEAGVHPILQ